MADEPVRWGILSTAGIAARALVPALQQSATAELVAVASRDENQARTFAEGHGIPVAHGSYEELLADDRIEAVYVPVPNSLHVDWSVRALEAGKHVLCEKPMDKDPVQIERAFDAAAAAGRLITEGFMWRHHLDTIAMSELVAGGSIGHVRHIRSTFAFTLPAGRNIRLDPELDGGALMDVACYPVSAVRLFAGEPRLVSASWVIGPSGVDESIVAMMNFPDEVSGTIFGSMNAAPLSVIEVIGSERILVMRWPFAPFIPAEIELRTRNEVESLMVSSDNRYRRMVDDFNAAIRGGSQPLLDRDDAVGQARTMAALRASAEQDGAPIRLG